MTIPLPTQLYKLAKSLPAPLYVVGGYVRDYLLSGKVSNDLDICSSISEGEFSVAAAACGYKIKGVYGATRTALCTGSRGEKVEYTSFRRDEYPKGGAHTPISTAPLSNPEEDAVRRDFTCNAVYYDVLGQKLLDPLGGLKDIENGVLRAANPYKVFGSDGLRLMRLGRFTGELGFTPERQTLEAAYKNAKLITDVAPERVFSELKLILSADTKHAFSPKDGHYRALKILDETRVLDYIIPELTLGRGMPQRGDYHNYDVLEHTLRAVMYAPQEVRLAALLHDVAKPACMIKTGKYSGHDAAGVELTKQVLTRLRADKKTILNTAFLVGGHMKDLSGEMKESKVRAFVAQNYEHIENLLLLKQADYSAGKDDLGVSPVVKKWREIIRRMRETGAPFCVRDLKIKAETLKQLGYCGVSLGKELRSLFISAAAGIIANDEEQLILAAKRDLKAGKRQ